MMATDNVADLIARIALRDREAFRVLYHVSGSKLFGVCLRILKDRADAEEALQEIFIKIWWRSDRFAKGQASPMAWLCTIARNHCIDLLRSRKPNSVKIDEIFDVADPSASPEDAAMLSAEGRRIDRCMAELETSKARAVKDAYVEGLSYQELAQRYEVPLNTMKTWLRRSLLRLRECMER